MKLRIISLLLATVFLLCGIVGCQQTSDLSDESVTTSELSHISSDVSDDISENYGETSENTSNNTADDTSAPDKQPEDPDQPDEPIIDQIDFFTENGQSLLPENFSLPAYVTETEISHLYSCNIDLPDAEGFSAFVNGDVLYLFYWLEDEHCSMFSLETGELIIEILLPVFSNHGMLDNGGFWVVDNYDLRTVFYDTEGRCTIVRESAAISEENVPHSAMVTSDGKYLLAAFTEGDPLVVYNLESETELSPTFDEDVIFWSIEQTREGIVLWGNDGVNLLLDPATGETKPYDTETSVTYYGDICSYYTDGTLILGNDKNLQRFYMDLASSEALAALDFGCAVTEIYEFALTLNFYDLRNGKFISQLELSEDFWGVRCSFTGEGAVVILANTEYGIDIYIYDLSSAAKEQGQSVDTFVFTDEELKTETDRIAAETEEKTGVDLLYGSEGNDFVIFDYVGVAELNAYEVFKAVSTVSEILSLYPEGMLREVYEPNYKGLQIYLCANIYGIVDSSVSNAGGVTTESDGYILIALDVHSILHYDLPHELSHAFDRRISYVGLKQGTDWLTFWENATPFADAYTNTYDEYYENYDYTYEGESDEENIWFIDGYARTFPTEDRARIMEHLFNPTEGGLADELQYENLQYKARLYCYIIRQCFPSCNAEEALPWELYLGEIDAVEFQK